jgi:hypothetical protein
MNLNGAKSGITKKSNILLSGPSNISNGAIGTTLHGYGPIGSVN